MHILIPRFDIKHTLNRFWAKVRRTPLAPFVCHQAQAPLASDLLQYRNPWIGEQIARGLFAQPLRGAGPAWESRRNLSPASETAVDLTGANSRIFNVYDFWSVMVIGLVYQTAGTVTAMVMDFDKYPVVNSVGTVVDKLDTVNGVITAPTVASQAIGAVLHKDLANLIDPIDLLPGSSIVANVTTTVTAGTGMPFVIGCARAETFTNLTAKVVSA